MKQYGLLEITQLDGTITRSYKYTLEEFRVLLLEELKTQLSEHFEIYAPSYKQQNLANGLLDESEAIYLKSILSKGLSDYQIRKFNIMSETNATLLEHYARDKFELPDGGV